MLQVRDLAVSYGGAVRALRGVSVDVGEREVVAVLGSNGAGKTTLLRAASGTLSLHGGRMDTGGVTFAGRRLDGRRPDVSVRSGIVQVPEGRRIFGRLTVEENLRAGGFGTPDRRARAAARERVYELFPILAERRRQRAGLLSGGEQQMLAIGRALMASPKLLLLDEPSLGLAPRVVGVVRDIIREIHAQGTSVLLVEQNATMALAVAHRACVLELGRVSLTGTADELAASDRVRDLYLGGRTEDAAEAAASRSGDGAVLGRWVR